jgi:hypothetical protein
MHCVDEGVSRWKLNLNLVVFVAVRIWDLVCFVLVKQNSELGGFAVRNCGGRRGAQGNCDPCCNRRPFFHVPHASLPGQPGAWTTQNGDA